MCGITGIVGFTDADASRAAVNAATACVRHRGPDATGYYADASAMLGHRRLSVIDPVERSNQPMAAPDGSAVLVCNGEIYNYRELRSELANDGERFVSSSDTEVLLRLLLRDDVGALPRLYGMFALALWRPHRRELLLARDRFGEKPLFVARTGRALAFASEIAALLEYPGVERRLDASVLAEYLEAGFVAAPRTMVAGITSLEPGQWLRWRDGEVTTGAYYTWSPKPDAALADPVEASRAVFDALSAAVRRQSVSDVPLGAFLSGGIDSSSVVALLQRESDRPVKTFTVRFEDARYDESVIARRVAEHLGTDHHELTVSDATFHADDLWRIIDHVGQPFYDSSAIPTFIVSRYAREHVTVALSGDGGDEMFAGYPVFEWARRIEQLSRAPGAVLAAGAGVLRAAAPFAPARAAGTVRQGRKALEIAALRDDAERFNAIHELMGAELVASLISAALRARAVPRDDALPPDAAAWTPLRRMMYVRARRHLANDMLVKVDRMSMAASLEVRAPFLDPQVADLSARLPDAHLIHGGVGKHVLREAMRPHLPAEVFSHPKWGFSIPLHRFINDEFRGVARDLLSANGPLRGVLEPGAVRAVVDRGLSHTADDATTSVFQSTHQLWALMQLAAWMQRFRIAV